MSKVITYTVRVTYEGGMETLDVAASNRHECIIATVRLIKIRERNLGVHKKLLSITIEGE